MDKLRYKEIGDYYVCDIMLIASTLVFVKDIDEPVKREVNDIFYKYFECFSSNNAFGCPIKIAFLRESLIGDFITWNPQIYLKENLEVTYEKIVGAYNTAIITDNEKMANKLYPFFIDYTGANMSKLFDHSNDNIKDYILDNYDFFGYINEQKGEAVNDSYLVYENGSFQKKQLNNKVQKVKK